MHLLTGAAGSGKTYRILESFRDALRRRDTGVRLLTPTATMEQHLRNTIAREGFVFRPRLIETLSHFVDEFAADLPQVSEPLLYLTVEDAASRIKRPEFTRVEGMPGFCAALARAIEEFSSAGCDGERLWKNLARVRSAAPLGEAFLAIYQEVESELRDRGLALRGQRLLHAAERIEANGLGAIHTIWLDGFFALPEPELAVIRALRRYADVTLSLPSGGLTEATRQRLLAMGFEEQTCTWEPALVRVERCATPSIEREADEIARRILHEAAGGRPFRDIGVIVRSPEIYAPMLRTAFDRCGIPARFYFDADLSQHAVVRCLSGVVDALLGGFDHPETLAAIRLAPYAACDEFDFAVRERMPGTGLDALRGLAKAPTGLLDSFAALEPWCELTLAPPDWVERLKSLRRLCNFGQPEPRTYEIASIARGQAAALDLFDQAIDNAACALAQRPIRLTEFWRAAKSALRLTPLRVDDSRRNVVHVLDAHEARQWRLPVVFVCGLVERQFPKFHAQDPFFPDAARAQLNQSGIRLRTASDFEAEERFLFDCAVTRATESLTLTYPQSDARGQQTLPSLYLESVGSQRSEWQTALPRPGRKAGEGPPSVIVSPDLLDTLMLRHQVFKPTALESYLQCAFQFFGRYTLRLEGAPAHPEERLDFLTQGNIVHAVLAQLPNSGRQLEEVFDEVFARICTKQRVPPGYRTEAFRERMLSDLRAFLGSSDWPWPYEIRTEQEFEYTAGEDVRIKGRIDRVEVTPDGRGSVTDYKYSNAQNAKGLSESEDVLQPHLYLLALELVFRLHPDGMRYVALKGGVRSANVKSYRREFAIEGVQRLAAEIRAGRIEPHPANQEKCRYCDFRDACRFQFAEAALAEGAAT